MAPPDIRLDRIKHEYEGVRNTQDALMDRIDTYEEAILGLTQAVASNRELIIANHESTQRQIKVLNEKVDRLMAHLDVPPKPPAGFVKD